MSNVNHSARKHALLSASGADRWMHCTPSARLEENFTEKSSVYAEEGTLAHEFGNVYLMHEAGQITTKILNQELRKLRKHDLYTEEMEPEVDKYVEIVMEKFNAAKQHTPDAELLIEERLDFSHIVEQGFGTGDANIVADKVLDVNDLKYGKGVQVDAEMNAQLMLYGLGALRKFDMMFDIETVRLSIIQPRLDHYSTWEISVEDLIAWGENQVKPKAKMAYNGEGEHVPGSWCKFCKAKPVCRALAEQNLQLAKYEFRSSDTLEDHEILDILKQVEPFTDWIKAVTAYALDEALKGKKWDGYKLVAGRSVRKWKDEEEVKKILIENKFKYNQFMQSKLGGITHIQALVGKKNIDTLLGTQIIKPEGAPTLVPASDKRTELNSLEKAQEEFGGTEED